MEDTLYEVLGVAFDASSVDIADAYRRLAKKVHPDNGGNASLFRRVQTAYDVLSVPRRRVQYDLETFGRSSVRRSSEQDRSGTSEENAYSTGDRTKKEHDCWQRHTQQSAGSSRRDESGTPTTCGGTDDRSSAGNAPTDDILWSRFGLGRRIAGRYVPSLLLLSIFWALLAGHLPHSSHMSIGVFTGFRIGACGFLLSLGIVSLCLRYWPRLIGHSSLLVVYIGAIVSGTMLVELSFLGHSQTDNAGIVGFLLALWGMNSPEARRSLLKLGREKGSADADAEL
nr:DnaJ domain-containing protein [Ferrimicrobium acidiphilum]